MDIDDLRRLNGKALDELNAAVATINGMLTDPDLGLDDEARLLARRGALFTQITTQSLVQGHLKASKLVVEFKPAELKDFEKLEEKLDAAILSGIKLNAMLSLVPKLVDAASDVATAITSHTAAA
jgi:hypothetical protein